MEEDEELYREMNEEDDFYMGDCDEYADEDCEREQFRFRNNRPSPRNAGAGCLVMLPLLAGALTFVVVVVLAVI